MDVSEQKEIYGDAIDAMCASRRRREHLTAFCFGMWGGMDLKMRNLLM